MGAEQQVAGRHRDGGGQCHTATFDGQAGMEAPCSPGSVHTAALNAHVGLAAITQPSPPHAQPSSRPLPTPSVTLVLGEADSPASSEAKARGASSSSSAAALGRQPAHRGGRTVEASGKPQGRQPVPREGRAFQAGGEPAEGHHVGARKASGVSQAHRLSRAMKVRPDAGRAWLLNRCARPLFSGGLLPRSP